MANNVKVGSEVIYNGEVWTVADLQSSHHPGTVKDLAVLQRGSETIRLSLKQLESGGNRPARYDRVTEF